MESKECVPILSFLMEKVEKVLSAFYDMPSPVVDSSLKKQKNCTVTIPCNNCVEPSNWKNPKHEFQYEDCLERFGQFLACEAKDEIVQLPQLCPDLFHKLKMARQTVVVKEEIKSSPEGILFHGVLDDKEEVCVRRLDFNFDVTRSSEVRHLAYNLSNLRHPNLISFYQLSLPSPQSLLLVLDTSAQCTSLASLLAKENSSFKQTKKKLRTKIALDVAEALEFLHQQNFAHKSLNSSTVLILSTNISDKEKVNAKLSEPGILFSISSQTKKPLHVWDWVYLAPEVLNHEFADHWADCYSYGIFLYELFSASRPFSSFLLTLTSSKKENALLIFKQMRLIVFGRQRPVCDRNWPQVIQVKQKIIQITITATNLLLLFDCAGGDGEVLVGRTRKQDTYVRGDHSFEAGTLPWEG